LWSIKTIQIFTALPKYSFDAKPNGKVCSISFYPQFIDLGETSTWWTNNDYYGTDKIYAKKIEDADEITQSNVSCKYNTIHGVSKNQKISQTKMRNLFVLLQS
jgi:hypothetical protein